MPVQDYQYTEIGNGRPWKWGVLINAATKQSTAALLWTLHDLGGSIEDGSGLAATKLASTAVKRGMAPHPNHMKGQALSTLMGQLERGRMGGCIERVTNGKRTKKITLLLSPDEMPPRPPVQTRPAQVPKQRSLLVQPVADDGGTGPRPEPESPAEPAPEPSEPPAPGPRPDDPNVALSIVGDAPAEEVVEPTIPPLVAVSVDPIAKLFAIQADLMSATVAVGEMSARLSVQADRPEPVVDETIAERLAATLEENNRLRRQLNEARDTAAARKHENDGLRKQILVAQNNLRALQKASAEGSQRERNLARLNGNQRFISARPEPAIAARQ